MSVELITGVGESPHVDSADFGALNAAIVGSGDYVFSIGSKCSYAMTNNNNFVLNSGEILLHGRHVRITGSVDLTIDNCDSGYKRRDTVIVKYKQISGIETATVEVKKGNATASGTPSAAALSQEDVIGGGASVYEMPLYYIDLNGSSYAVTKVFKEVISISEIGNLKSEIINLIYPVGRIYVSTSSTSPETLFGGKWERFGKGRCLVGVDEADTDFASSGKTGGSKSMQKHTHTGPSHTHTGPSHSHSFSWSGSHSHGAAVAGYFFPTSSKAVEQETVGAISGTGWQMPQTKGGFRGDNATGSMTINVSGTTGAAGTGATGSAGTGATGSAGSGESGNLQPYITVYMWRRIS